MIRFKCPHCGKGLGAENAVAGRVGKCPGCGQRIGIPEPGALDPTDVDKIIDMLDRDPSNKARRQNSPWAWDDDES